MTDERYTDKHVESITKDGKVDRRGVVVEETDARIRVQWPDRRTWLAKNAEGKRWCIARTPIDLLAIYPLGSKLRTGVCDIVTIIGSEDPKLRVRALDGDERVVLPSELRHVTVD